MTQDSGTSYAEGPMGAEVLNTVFESSLRILLLVGCAPQAYFSNSRILALDFICCYGKEYGLASENLHGDNNFMYGEIARRYTLVKEAIKQLVVHGMLHVQVKQGFRYRITKDGLAMAERFSCPYAQEYRRVAELSIEKYSAQNEEELLKKIQKSPVRDLKR